MKTKIKLLALFATVFLISCATAGRNTKAGSIAGGAIGAGVGAFIGSQTGTTAESTVIGSLVGAGAGATVGNVLDQQQEAINQQDEAIERQEQIIAAQGREIEQLRRASEDKITFNHRDNQRNEREKISESKQSNFSFNSFFNEQSNYKTARSVKGETEIKARLGIEGDKGPSSSEKRSAVNRAGTVKEKNISYVEDLSNTDVSKRLDSRDNAFCQEAKKEAALAENASAFLEKLIHLRRASRLCPNNPEYYNRIGKLYLSNGKISEAKEQFNKALEADPSNSEALRNLLQLKEKSGIS